MGSLTDRFERIRARLRETPATPLQPRCTPVASPRQPPQICRAEPFLGHRFGDLAKRLLKELKRAYDPFARVRRAWATAAPDLQQETAILDFSHGALEVGVANQVLRSEIESFMSESLLHALRETPEGADVERLTFRLTATKDGSR